MNLIVYAECYANRCLAEQLRNHGIITNLRHAGNYGRDMILAKVAEKKGCNAEGPTLLVIDYELGDARVYIEENFDIVETNAQWSTHLARFRRCRNVAAVIFDPAIDHEKGPICRADPTLCQGDNRRRVKSKDACRLLGGVLNNHLQPLVAWIAQNIPKLYTW